MWWTGWRPFFVGKRPVERIGDVCGVEREKVLMMQKALNIHWSGCCAAIFGILLVTVACTQRAAVPPSAVLQRVPAPDRSAAAAPIAPPPPVIADVRAHEPPPRSKDLQAGLVPVFYHDFFYRHLRHIPREDDPFQHGRRGSPIAMLNHQFGREEIFDSGASRGVAVRMTGLIRLARPGLYGFQALANDGIRITLAGRLMLEDPSQHGDRLTPEARVAVTEPGWFPLQIEYFQRKGTAAIALYWRPPGASALTAVPAEALAHLK